MLRLITVGCLSLILLPLAAQGQQVLFTEDFESGLGAWTEMIWDNGLISNNDPQLISSPAEIYGPNTGWPGGTVIGYTSALATFDGQGTQWVQQQWEAQVAPGLYTVEVTMDRYVYYANLENPPPNGDPWGLGNRVYVLTDSLYNNSELDMDLNDGTFGSGVDGVRFTLWCGDDGQTWSKNGIWQSEVKTNTIDTATGNIEFRLLCYEKYKDPQTTAWDNVTLVLKDAGDNVVFTFSDDFESGMGNWEARVKGPEPDDTPETFTFDDPKLYTNIDNPGSTSAGYSSDQQSYEPENAAYMMQQFPAALPPGTYSITYEYDAYVYKYENPTNDVPELFPASGAGIEGPNNNYPGSQSAGWSSNLAVHDGSVEVWMQQQFPAALTPGGTYDVHVEADVYAYSDGGDPWSQGSRLYLLTDDSYDNPSIGVESDVSPGFRWTLWNSATAGNPNEGGWVHQDKIGTFTTATGNLEIRLLCTSKYEGSQASVFDNVSYTVTDPNNGNAVVFSFTEDFEAGMDDWTTIVHPNDPYQGAQYWAVGNRMYVLTDDQYDDPAWHYDQGDIGGGWSSALWNGDSNGVWQHFVQTANVTTTTGNIEVRLLIHDKEAKAQAVAWDNLTLTFDLPDLPCGDPWFDSDEDSDVDQMDFAAFQACYTGVGDPDGTFDIDACICMDIDGDFDVDEADLTSFEGCASGPETAADPTCDEQACCFSNGTCADYVPALCTLQGGTPQGSGSTCAGTVCP